MARYGSKMTTYQLIGFESTLEASISQYATEGYEHNGVKRDRDPKNLKIHPMGSPKQPQLKSLLAEPTT